MYWNGEVFLELVSHTTSTGINGYIYNTDGELVTDKATAKKAWRDYLYNKSQYIYNHIFEK